MPWWTCQRACPSQFFKGGSSHWINQNALIPGKFAWGRGYGVFSVSHSGVGEVANYIAKQDEHHRKRSYSQELRLFVERYGLKWRDDKIIDPVSITPPVLPPAE